MEAEMSLMTMSCLLLRLRHTRATVLTLSTCSIIWWTGLSPSSATLATSNRPQLKVLRFSSSLSSGIGEGQDRRGGLHDVVGCWVSTKRSWWRSCRAGSQATMMMMGCPHLRPQRTKATALTLLMRSMTCWTRPRPSSTTLATPNPALLTISRCSSSS